MFLVQYYIVNRDRRRQIEPSTLSGYRRRDQWPTFRPPPDEIIIRGRRNTHGLLRPGGSKKSVCVTIISYDNTPGPGLATSIRLSRPPPSLTCSHVHPPTFFSDHLTAWPPTHTEINTPPRTHKMLGGFCCGRMTNGLTWCVLLFAHVVTAA